MSRISSIITREDLLHTVTITLKDLPNGAVQIVATPNLYDIAERAVHSGNPPTMAETYAMRILRAASELNQQISQNKGQPIIITQEALAAYLARKGRRN